MREGRREFLSFIDRKRENRKRKKNISRLHLGASFFLRYKIGATGREHGGTRTGIRCSGSSDADASRAAPARHLCGRRRRRRRRRPWQSRRHRRRPAAAAAGRRGAACRPHDDEPGLWRANCSLKKKTERKPGSGALSLFSEQKRQRKEKERESRESRDVFLRAFIFFFEAASEASISFLFLLFLSRWPHPLSPPLSARQLSPRPRGGGRARQHAGGQARLGDPRR